MMWAAKKSESQDITHIVKGDIEVPPIINLLTLEVDDDVWLNVQQLELFLSSLEDEPAVYGFVNNYFLDVARPGPDQSKVSFRTRLEIL